MVCEDNNYKLKEITKMKFEVMFTEQFEKISIDVMNNVEQKGSMYFTREQIGQALEYAEPIKAIEQLHGRNREILDKYAVTLSAKATDGKMREMTLYNRRGVYTICSLSKQPKAREFMEWVWDIVDKYISGDLMDKKTFMDGVEIVRKSKCTLMEKASLVCNSDEVLGWRDPNIALAESTAIRKYEYQDKSVERELGFAINESVEAVCEKHKSLNSPRYCTYIHHKRYWNKNGMSEIENAIRKDRQRRNAI